MRKGLDRLLKETDSFILLLGSYISYHSCISFNFLPEESLFTDYVNTNISRNYGNRFHTTVFIDAINLLFAVISLIKNERISFL